MIGSTIRAPVRRLADLVANRALQDAGIIFGGNIVAQGISFVAGMIVIRHFQSPDLKPQYAMLSLAMAVMSMFTSYSILGMNAGIIRFGALYLKEKPKRAHLIFRVNVEVKTAVGLLVTLAGAGLATWLARWMFDAGDLSWVVRIAFIGVLGGTVLDAMQIIMQTHQKFVRTSIQLVSVQAARLMGIVAMILLGVVTGRRLLIFYVTLPYVGALVGFLLAPKDFLRARGSRWDVVREQASFSVWVILSAACTILTGRLGILLLKRMAQDMVIVANYSAAFTLIMPLKLVVIAMGQAFMPRVARIKDTRHFWGYLGKVTALALLLIAVMTPMLWLIRYPIEWKLEGYVESIPIFQILAVSVFIDLLIVPAGLVVYSLNKTYFGAILNMAQLACFIVVARLCIPRWGAEGAAAAEVAIRLLGLAYMGALVPILLWRRGKRERRAATEKEG